MNLRFRLRQFRNAIQPPKKQEYEWIFIYGVPRSGTTYFYQELMQLAQLGVSDYDLGKFAPVIEHIENSGYIPIDTKALLSFISDQLTHYSEPGGGNRYDYIIKQVNTHLEEYQLLCKLMGSEPIHKYFIFREPMGWLPSAKRKFNISDSEAINLYDSSLRSYESIGGNIIEYGENMIHALNDLKIATKTAFFLEDKRDLSYSMTCTTLLQQYESFKLRHLSTRD